MLVARCLAVAVLTMPVLVLSAVMVHQGQTSKLVKVRKQSSLAAQSRLPRTTDAPQPQTQPTRRGLGRVISYGATKYPFLGFAVVSGGLTVANAATVRATLHGREQDVLRRKKAEGKPAIDLTNEIKAAKEKYKDKLEKISSGE